MTSSVIFFFNDTATTEIYTLSLHDALPISAVQPGGLVPEVGRIAPEQLVRAFAREYHLDVLARRLGQEKDRKSTRLNSSHLVISYAVFCLKKKIDLLRFTRLYNTVAKIVVT